VILLISPNSSLFAQYKLQLVLWFQHKINSVNKHSVASCTTVPKFTHFSYFLTKQVP